MIPELEHLDTPPEGIWMTLRSGLVIGAHCPTRNHAVAVAQLAGMAGADRIAFVIAATILHEGRTRKGAAAIVVYRDGLAEGGIRFIDEWDDQTWLPHIDSWMVDAARRGFQLRRDDDLASVYTHLLTQSGVTFA